MVTEPAIESDFVFFSKDKDIVKEAFSSDEKHMVYGIGLGSGGVQQHGVA